MRTVILAAALAAVTSAVGAQAFPDFSGVWVQNTVKTTRLRTTALSVAGADSAPRPAGANATAPPQWQVTQTVAIVSLERVPSDGFRTVYKLDGTESVNKADRPTSSRLLTTHTHWDSARLVTEGTETTQTARGVSVIAIREVRWIDPDGDMIVETTRDTRADLSATLVTAFSRRR